VSCVDCGKEVVRSGRGKSPLRCAECRLVHQRRWAQEYRASFRLARERLRAEGVVSVIQLTEERGT
jgi:endogenous inhibitor of DNA gyrase (YacG/DUF329 family)